MSDEIPRTAVTLGSVPKAAGIKRVLTAQSGNGKTPAAKTPAPKPATVKTPAPKTAAPKIVNRGPAGLLIKLSKKPAGEKQETQPKEVKYARWQIAPAIAGLAVSIDSLNFDEDNARLHPEKNMEAIKASLTRYGQTKPVVVQQSKMKIVAGNGTVMAAKELGWTEIAAAVIDMTDIEATGYGIADNRAGELATWDIEVVARLSKLLGEAGEDPIGWSADELEVLRAGDFTPPAYDASMFAAGGGGGDEEPLVVSFTPDEMAPVAAAIAHVRDVHGDADMTQARAIQLICEDWCKMESVNQEATQE